MNGAKGMPETKIEAPRPRRMAGVAERKSKIVKLQLAWRLQRVGENGIICGMKAKLMAMTVAAAMAVATFGAPLDFAWMKGSQHGYVPSAYEGRDFVCTQE